MNSVTPAYAAGACPARLGFLGACGAVALAAVLACCAPAEPETPHTERPAAEASARTPEPASGAQRMPAPRFERFTIADGLASGGVDAVLQDRLGFLWVGTWNGLHRYDGASFTAFLHDPADAASIGSAWVWDLYEDRAGHLWAGTEAGLSRFDPATEAFTNYRHDPENPTSLSHSIVRSIVEDAEGTLWAGTSGGGLNRFDPETETFTPFLPDPEDPESPKNTVYALAVDSDGALWVGTDGGLARFDPTTGTFRHIGQGTGAAAGVVPPDVFALEQGRSGALWVGSLRDGLYRLDPATETFTHYPFDPSDPGALGHPWVLSLLEDRAGVLWVGTDGGGLHRYDPAADAFARYTYDPTDLQSLSDNHVLALFEDRSGVLWAGTYEGIDRRYPLSRTFAYERHRPGEAGSLRPNEVKAFLEDRTDALWVGTDLAGVSRRDPATGRFTHHPHDPDDPDHGKVAALAEDSSGAVWVGTRAGLDRWNPETGRFSRYTVPEGDSVAWSSTLISMLAVEKERLWAATYDGLLSINPQTGRAAHYVPDSDDPGSPDYNVLLGILPDSASTVWVGSFDGGLGRLDTETGAFAHRYDRTGPGTVRWGHITGLHRDPHGTLWVGTDEAGLVRMEGERLLEAERLDEGEGLEITRYSLTEGLPSQVVYNLLGDDQGRLWITTPQGLSWFDVETETFRSFGASDGLLGVWGLYQSPYTGTIYMSAAPQGYYTFDPAAVAAEPPPAPLLLTGLRLLNEQARVGAKDSPLGRPLWMTDALRLRHDDRVVTFEFAALDFRAPATHRYAVRLDGFDEDWREVGNQREATFTNLGPGSYTLRVRVAGRDGVWSTNEASLAVMVAPPWWRAWWAYALYALLALGAVYAVERTRQRRRSLRHRLEIERLEAEKLRDLDRARSRFFANVSHEFRTPLTLTLGPLDDLKAGLHGPLAPDVAEQVDLAHRNAGRVLGLINQILDVARLEAGRMHLRAGRLDLAAFVHRLAQPFAALAERKGIALDVSAPNAPVEVWADADHLEKVLANLLSNALKYTPEGGTVRMSVEAEAEEVHVTVRDSGPGIAVEALPHIFDRFFRVDESAASVQPSTGIGLALAKELVELHGGRIEVESEEGFGAAFSVWLPRGNAHLAPDQIVPDGEATPWTPAEQAAALLPLAAENGRNAGDEAEEDARADVTTVLVVEDHADVRAYIRRHLEPAYCIAEAPDGAEGLEKARALLPDLIISDVMMPGMDGLAFCRALKDDPETDFIPVILLTAKAAPEDRLDGLREHADDYLTKPFDVRELKVRVDNLIASRKRLRERFAAGNGHAAALHPTPVDVPSADADFLEHVREIVEAHLGNEDFTVEQFAEEAGHSRSHLHRRLKALLDLPPSELIRTMRLERAAQLLEARAGSVSEVAYAVGFKSVAHFSNSFHRHFGLRPSAYPEAAE